MQPWKHERRRRKRLVGCEVYSGSNIGGSEFIYGEGAIVDSMVVIWGVQQ
jgi:hypothetical protein